MITEDMMKRAAQVFCDAGFEISLPSEGDLDDVERERYNTLHKALTAALSDQVAGAEGDAHQWHMKPTTIPDEMFQRPTFVADALRKMVANCVSLHAGGNSLYTDGERKAMLAAAEHIEAFVAAAPPSSPAAGE